MSVNADSTLTMPLREAVLHLAWTQWRALGAPLDDRDARQVSSVIDPEALICLSLRLAESERRLLDALAWWAAHGGRLTSVHRLNSMARRWGNSTADLAKGYREGLATNGASMPQPFQREARGSPLPVLRAGEVVMLKLRAAFGVGARSDVLTYLLTTKADGATIREMAWALDYTAASVRQAADGLALSGLGAASSTRPRQYSVNRGQWWSTLSFSSPQPWHPHAQLFALAVDLIDWADQTYASAFLQASRARDLMERHARIFDLAGLMLPPPPHSPGAGYADEMSTFITAFANWLHRDS